MRWAGVGGGVLDAVVREWGQQFQGLSFGVETSDALMGRARRAAVADGVRRPSYTQTRARCPIWAAFVSVSESGGCARE